MDKVEAAVTDLLAALGFPADEHLRDTPRRVARAWRDQTWGYEEEPGHHLRRTFPAPDDAGLIVQAGIDVQSICAHHLLPFGGRATVAYRPRPGAPIVGLSKLARLVYGYAARLQVQERIGNQVTAALMDELNPVGAVCLITASHDCMRLRGVRSPRTETTTESVGGLLAISDINLARQLHVQGATLL